MQHLRAFLEDSKTLRRFGVWRPHARRVEGTRHGPRGPRRDSNRLSSLYAFILLYLTRLSLLVSQQVFSKFAREQASLRRLESTERLVARLYRQATRSCPRRDIQVAAQRREENLDEFP